jgi:hypothetical protein
VFAAWLGFTSDCCDTCPRVIVVTGCSPTCDCVSCIDGWWATVDNAWANWLDVKAAEPEMEDQNQISSFLSTMKVNMHKLKDVKFS